MRTTTALALTATSLIAGCANAPLPPLKGPGFSVAESTGTGQSAPTLEQARQQLLHTRAVYREGIAEQLAITQNTNTGLVALGALVAGLASGRAHRDAIVGVSLLGGTGYALANLSLDKRRVLAFGAGIKALDCAQSAVVGMELDKTAADALRKASGDLTAALGEAARHGETVQRLLDQLVAASGIKTEALAEGRRRLAEVESAMAAAKKSRDSADKLTRDTRAIGQRLSATVFEISNKVDGVIALTVPDISAVQQAVAGLGGFAGAFAPGAGLDAGLADALAGYKSKVAQANSGNLKIDGLHTELSDSLVQLAAATRVLVRRADDVNALLVPVDGTAVAAALKACDVADVVLPMSLEPASLALTSGQKHGAGFAILNGTKPYTVRLLDGSIEGLNIAYGGGFTDSAVLTASDKVPGGTYRVLVSDSSNPRNSRPLTVTVAPAGATPAPSTTEPPADAATMSSLVKNLNALKEVSLQGVAVAVVKGSAKPVDNNSKIELDITCTGLAPGKLLNRSDVLDKLLTDASKGTSKPSPNPLVIKKQTPNCTKA